MNKSQNTYACFNQNSSNRKKRISRKDRLRNKQELLLKEQKKRNFEAEFQRVQNFWNKVEGSSIIDIYPGGHVGDWYTLDQLR